MIFDVNNVKAFKNVIDEIVDARIDRHGMSHYISAKVNTVNPDGTINVYLLPDTNNTVSNLLNKTGEVLTIGDDVELCTKNGKLSNAWVALKHGTNVQGGGGGLRGASFRYKGSWSYSAQYYNTEDYIDVVEYNGSLYACIQSNYSNIPSSSPTYWGLMVNKGEKGDIGETGPKGDKGDKGVSFRHLGTWNGSTTYVNNSTYIDVVTLNGSSYACILTHTNFSPPNSTYWVLIANKGDTGLKGDTGTKGDTGAKGDQGLKGDTGATGTSLRNKGAWSSSTAYVNNVSYIDLVYYNGSFYACKLSNTNQTPTNTTYWDLIVSKGDTGAKGDKGDKGDTGSPGTNGTNGIDGLDINWKGTYGSATSYVKNDAVSYNGSSYICKLATTGNVPTNTTYWDLMAQKGQDGQGSGDMLKSTYDPNNKQADTFNMDNMVEGANNKILTSTERTKLTNLSGTNSGDETSSTIKTKLGITTLSGSNTGDETATTIKTKLGITTLSGSNTGDETIDTIKTKLGITTLSGSNTGDETASTIKTKLGITTLSGSNTGDQDLSGLQPKLVSGTNIKTINGTTLLGSGDIAISGATWANITGSITDNTSLMSTFIRLGSGGGLVPQYVGDLNTLVGTCAVMATNASANRPNSSYWSYVLQIKDERVGTNTFQLAVCDAINQVYSRVRDGSGNWSVWKQLAFVSSGTTGPSTLAPGEIYIQY